MVLINIKEYIISQFYIDQPAMSKNNTGIEEIISSDEEKPDNSANSHQPVPDTYQRSPINESIQINDDHEKEEWIKTLKKSEAIKPSVNRESFAEFNGSSDEEPNRPSQSFKRNKEPPISFQTKNSQKSPRANNPPRKTSISSSESSTQINKIREKYNHSHPQEDSDPDEWEDTNQIVVDRLKVQKSSKEYLIDEGQQSRPDDDNIAIDIHRSMFTENTAKKLLAPIIQKQKQKQKQKQQQETNKQQEAKKVEKQEEKEAINVPIPSDIYESVYMQGGIQFQAAENKMWWLFKDKIYIEKHTLDVLFEEFLRKNQILPLFSESQSQMEFSIQVRYMERYTALLNKRFQNHFKEVFDKMAKGIRKGSFELDSQCQSSVDPSESSLSFKGLYEKYLFKKLSPSLGYSKVQLTRNYFLKKLNSLKAYEECFNFITEEDYQDKVKREEQYKLKIEQIQEEIADLQIIVSFQNTEEYCKTKSQKLEKKIWKERLIKNNQLKEAWIKLRQQLSKKETIFCV